MIIGSLLSYYVTLLIMEKTQNESLEGFMECPIIPKICKNLKLNRYEKNVTQDVIDPNNLNIQLKDIVCDSKIKNDISFILESLKNTIPKDIPLLETPNGVLLHGPPGTGKTMLAKSIAKESNIPFINVSYSLIENKYFGESPKILSSYFSLANKIKPCILFFDEIDGFLSTRNSLDQSAVNGLKALFLTLMDGLNDRDHSILAIGATNRIDQLDPAVTRRMATHIYMDNPSKNQIKSYLKSLLPKETFDEDVIEYFYGMSYSNIKEKMKYCSKSRFLNNIHNNKWSSKDIIQS